MDIQRLLIRHTNRDIRKAQQLSARMACERNRSESECTGDLHRSYDIPRIAGCAKPDQNVPRLPYPYTC